ncbi:hypothetical protein AQJ11_41175 [Streptomyces corchorusii]|uniref:Uncharacterized protein n=1 Tax=Streptomyces corchorusii TaxID=1903 RepID=A0A117Q9J4_STRCK|nr:hypothetical protein AQJ11_41175 [Streptomyces corchorusii]
MVFSRSWSTVLMIPPTPAAPSMWPKFVFRDPTTTGWAVTVALRLGEPLEHQYTAPFGAGVAVGAGVERLALSVGARTPPRARMLSAGWAAVRDEEQVVSTVMQGPRGPRKYDSRPDTAL